MGSSVPTLGAHDLSLVEKHVRDLDRRREQAARIIAQVEDQCFPTIFFQLFEDFRQFIGRVLVEPGDADISNLLILIDQQVPLIVGFAACRR